MSPRGQYDRNKSHASTEGLSSMPTENIQPRPDRSTSPHKKRVPVGQRNRLTFEERPGYQRRVVNDIDGRVAIFEEAGYELVKVPTRRADPLAAEASQVGSVVRKPVGGGVEGVLMEIPKEWYEEDQQAKEERRLLKESTLLESNPQHVEGDKLVIKRPNSVSIE